MAQFHAPALFSQHRPRRCDGGILLRARATLSNRATVIEEFAPMVNTLLRGAIIRAPLAVWAVFQFLLIAFLLLLYAEKSHAADIARHYTGGVEVIDVNGIIVPEDQADFATVASASSNAVVVLNSPGDNAGMSGTPRRTDKECSASRRFSSLTGRHTTCRRHRNG
jgi:hypothetical protein